VRGAHHGGPEGGVARGGGRAVLAGPGSGDHAHRAAGGKRHLALLGVERGEDRLGTVVHRRTSFTADILAHLSDVRGSSKRGAVLHQRNYCGGGQETRVSQQVTMYTTPWCGFCRRLKGQLAREGIEVAEIDIERDPAA